MAVECRRLGFYVTLSSYRALTHRRWQSRDTKWRHMTSRDRMWREVRLSPEVTWKECRSPKTGVLCNFELLQGCNSQEMAVTWQEMTLRDLTWPRVIRKWPHFIGGHLDVAVEGRKLGFCVILSSYKAVTPKRWQSPEGKWPHIISRDGKWCLLPEVTWKWL